MFKKTIKKIVRSIFSNRYVIDAISKGINKYKIEDNSRNLIIGKDSKINYDAIIINESGLKENIIIGHNSLLRCTLLVFNYGGKITIGNWCYIGDNSRIWSGDEVIIGNNVIISHDVFITDTSSHELDYDLREKSVQHQLLYGIPTEKPLIKTKMITIEDNVWINPSSIILPGVRIGKGSIVSAGSIVTKDVEAFAMVAGNPARVIKTLKGYNE